MGQIAVYEALSYDKVGSFSPTKSAKANYQSCYQIFECLNDEEFRKVVAPEEERLLDQSRVKPTYH